MPKTKRDFSYDDAKRELHAALADRTELKEVELRRAVVDEATRLLPTRAGLHAFATGPLLDTALANARAEQASKAHWHEENRTRRMRVGVRSAIKLRKHRVTPSDRYS